MNNFTINNTIFNPDVNPAWASQTSWVLDPANGNDSNVGAGNQQVQSLVFSTNIITGNSISIDFASLDLSWKTIVQAFNTDNATTLQLLTDWINANIEATAVYDGLHTITVTGMTPGSQILINNASVTGGVSQATINITEIASAFRDSLKTWAEFRRRMLLVGGHTVEVNIYLPPTWGGDDMIFDWGSKYDDYIHIHGTPSIIRNGTLTAFSARVSNTPNIITDSGVSDWTPDIGFTSGRQICMTSGAAVGCCAGIVKNLGAHQARVGTFYDAINLVETNPSNGDKYAIIGKPFVQNFSFKNPSGYLDINSVDLGDNASTIYYVAPGTSTFGMEFVNCAVFFFLLENTQVFNINSILKFCPNLYQAQIQNLAGVIGDITGGESHNEIEQGGEFDCEHGTLFQGVGLDSIDNGFARIHDAGLFDVSINGAIDVGNGGRLRIEKIWGSGNAGYGLQITNSGQAWGNLSQCTITGNITDVFFCGANYSWSTILANNGVEANKGMACILYSGASEYLVASKVSVLNVVTGVDLKTTGQTTLNTVITSAPAGKKLYITDVLLIPTNANSVTGAPIVRVGKSPNYNEWAPLTTLTGLNANNQIFSLATAANGTIRSLFSPGDVVKIDVQTGATATSLTATVHVLGYFI